MEPQEAVRPQPGPSGARVEALHPQRLVYLPGERPCSLFSGRGILMLSWVEEIKSVLRRLIISTTIWSDFGIGPRQTSLMSFLAKIAAPCLLLRLRKPFMPHALFSLMDKVICEFPEKHIPDAAFECVSDGSLSPELVDLHTLRADGGAVGEESVCTSAWRDTATLPDERLRLFVWWFSHLMIIKHIHM